MQRHAGVGEFGETRELQTFHTQDLSFPRTKGPYGELSFPRNESSRNFRFFRYWELSFSGNESSRERSFPGPFVLGSSSELSFLGPFVPGNFRSHYPIGLVGALLCVLNYCVFGCDFALIIIILIILFVLNKTTQHMTAMQNYEQDQQYSTSAMMLTLL